MYQFLRSLSVDFGRTGEGVPPLAAGSLFCIFPLLNVLNTSVLEEGTKGYNDIDIDRIANKK